MQPDQANALTIAGTSDAKRGLPSEARDDPVAVYMNLKRSFTPFAAARASEL